MQRRPRRPRNLHPAIGVMVVTGLAPAGVLFGFGVLLIATGLFYGLLIPVQPFCGSLGVSQYPILLPWLAQPGHDQYHFARSILPI
jgi:hypothetical protein